MRRIIPLLLVILSAFNIKAFDVEIVGKEPAYVVSEELGNSLLSRVPVYLGIYPTAYDDPNLTFTIRTSYNNPFSLVKIDGNTVLSFDYEVTEAEINLAPYVWGYEAEDLTHLLTVINEYGYGSGQLFFARNLLEKGGCRLLCPNSPYQATVIGYAPNTKSIYVPEEIWITEEYCMPVVGIGHQAFLDATAIESIFIPNTLKTIQSDAFVGCTNLQSVNFEDGDKTIIIRNGSAFDGGMFRDSPLKSVHLGCPLEFTPGYTGHSPLYMKDKLEIVTFGTAAMTLFNDMFAGCSSLKSMVIPENVSLPTYEGNMYMTSQQMPSWGMFSDCSSLEEVEILSNMTTTCQGMFMHCTSLKSVKLPAEIEKLAPYTFWDCQQLPTIPDLPKLSQIGGQAFRNCLAFEKVVVPENVNIINGWYAFGWCENLKSLTLPPNIEVMSDKVFDFCNSLNEVVYDTDDPKEFNNSLFHDTPSNKTLYVPEKSIDKFKQIVPWKYFTNILPIPVAAQSISLDRIEWEAKIGDELHLIATVLPQNTTDEITWASDNESIVTVTSEGVVKAMSVGEATVIVKCGECVATCHVSVIPTLIESITFSVDSWNGRVGDSFTLEAIILPADASERTLTWTSSDISVATVNEWGTVVAKSEGQADIMARTSNDLSAVCRVTVDPILIDVAGIEIDRRRVTIWPGDTLTLVAKVTPEDATDKTITWSTSFPNVATVDNTGFVTAIDSGETIISAIAPNGISAECRVTVAVPVSVIYLDKVDVTLLPGESVSLIATVLPEDATDKSIMWSSSDNVCVTVEDGIVIAHSVGNSVITATASNGLTASCNVTVEPFPIAVTDIQLDQTNITLTDGSSITLAATVYPEDATDKTVTWTSTNNSVATVEDGFVLALNVGTTHIIAATSNGISATCTVTVEPRIVEATDICLDKTDVILLEGSSVILTATVLPENATDKSVSWTSSDSNIASVDAQGVVTALAAGVADIMAGNSNGMTATCRITVEPKIVEVSHIQLNEVDIKLVEGSSVTLIATIYPVDASDKSVIWASSDPTCVTVENGVVSAIHAGEALVTATASNGMVAVCLVRVEPRIIEATGIELDRIDVTLVEGESVTLFATVLPENATDKNVSWTSTDLSVVKVDAWGLVTAVGAGTAQIMAANSSGMTATCVVSVEPRIIEPTSIQLDMANMVLLEGDVVTLTATIFPIDATDKTVYWSSSNEWVVSVDGGRVTANTAGQAIITATASNGMAATCSVMVERKIVFVTEIILDPPSIQAMEGETVQIYANVFPADASDMTIEWTTYNDKVAEVNQKGLVTIISEGITEIKATAVDGSGVTAKCLVEGISGIESIIDKEEKADVYTINGLLLKKNADCEFISKLEKGIYILNMSGKVHKVMK